MVNKETEIQDENLVNDEEATSQSIEDNEKVEPTDKREGILDYIKSKWRGDEPQEEVEEDSTESKEEYTRTTEIPSEFLEAAKQDGWEQNDIEEFAAKYTDEQLKELAAQFTEEDEEEEEPEEIAEEPASEPKKDEDWESVVSSLKEEIRKEVLSELGPKFETLEDFQAEQADRQIVNSFETANKIMDGASKDFPALGEFDKMPKFTTGSRKGQLIPTSAEFKARQEVYDMADNLIQSGRSDSLEDAMDDALAWYRGKYGQKETERKVIRDLKKHEKKLSGARTGKETKKEYESTRDEIIDFIRSAQKAQGQ